MRNNLFKSNKLVSTLHVLATTIICETLVFDYYYYCNL